MILLPIGRDETEIRRHAWVSYVVIGLNIIVFFALAALSTRLDEGPLQAKWEQTMEYLLQHPYLEVPADLERFVPDNVRGELPAARESFERSGEVVSKRARDKQQTRLNDLSADLNRMVKDAVPAMRFGYVPANGTFSRLLTSMFIHADIFHLLGNLLFFFVSGPFIEDVFGRPLFAALYFLGGIAATLTYASQHPGSTIPLVGASGAIAAVMGAYLVRFFKSKVEFLFVPFILRPTINFRFFMPAFVVLPLWFIEQLVFAMAEAKQDGSGVAFSAHVGGFVFGLVFAGVIKAVKVEERFIHPAIESQIGWVQDEHLVRAREARARWDFPAARKEVAALLQKEPENLDARRQAYEIAFESEDWPSYGMAASKLLELYIQKKEHELAIDLIREATGHRDPHLPERFFIRAGQYAERCQEAEWAIDLYRQAARVDSSGSNGLRAMLQAAKLLRVAGHRTESRTLLQQAKSHPACKGEFEQMVSNQMAALDGSASGPRA